MSNFLVIETIIPPPGVPRDYIDGTDEADVLAGDRPDRTVDGFADQILGAGGDDLISPGLGDDFVFAGRGNDTIQASDGNDELYGGDGDDIVHGGDGRDFLYGDNGDFGGGSGDDVLYGGGGEDFLYPGEGDDHLVGGDGNDMVGYSYAASGVLFDIDANTITSSNGDTDTLESIELFGGSNFDDWVILSRTLPNYLNGGSGIDVLDFSRMSSGITFIVDTSDTANLDDPGVGQRSIFSPENASSVSVHVPGYLSISGGSIDWRSGIIVDFDSAAGSAFDDKLYGDSQDTDLYGGAGDDLLAGHGGDDLLVGGLGSDAIYGGDGRDMAGFGDLEAGVVVNLNRGEARQADGGVDALSSIEDLAGSDFNDVLVGDAGDNVIFGGDGNDRLNGRDGADVLAGGAGHDRYYMHDANDYVVEAAGEGVDRIYTWVDYWNDANVEELSGRHADHGLRLIGHGDVERIYGSGHGDRIDGWRGNDWLAGLAGDDKINGGAGADRIYGNSGDDYLRGGGGDDLLTGGHGDDRFVHRPRDGADVITDFDWNGDILDLSAHGIESFRAFQIMTRDTAEGALVDLGDAGSILLLGVAEADIRREDLEL